MHKLFFAVLAILSLTACGVESVDSADFDAALRGNPNAQFCGGIAGIQCPDGYECQLDGDYADAGGTCKRAGGPKPQCDHKNNEYLGTVEECAAIRFICAEGKQPFFDDCGCGCEDIPGEVCGDNVCGDGEECCNASCGTCVPTGGFCTQQVCEGTTAAI